MKTIEQAAEEYADSLKLDDAHRVSKQQFKEYSQCDFKAGVEFAQRWIPVEENLPDEGELVQAKYEIRLTDTQVKQGYTYAICQINKFTNKLWLVDNRFNGGRITQWRPIEYK